MPLSPGQRLDGYEIVSLVGAGAMGEVYRARDTRLNRDVALKILPPQMAGNPAAYARFEREAQAVAALSHPNILAVHDFGRTDAVSYVAFELLQGASLRERLASGALPVRKAIDYARQVADGLAGAHAKGITHRDIKPDNLFVTDDGRVKILDFGLAQIALAATPADGATTAPTQAPITDAGTVLGTVGYMAPEQVRGQAADHRTDLFALGATLYEMCTGTRAFKGATPADTMAAVLSSDPPELTLSGQPTPPALDRIVRRCLEKEPTERFQSALDLSFALDALSSLSGSGLAPAEAAPPAWRGWARPVVAALVALVAGIGAGRMLRPASAPAPPVAPGLRAEFNSAIGLNYTIRLALSPDGRRLVYSDVLRDSGVRQLFLRDLATGESSAVPESADGAVATWSPQSDALLFVSANRELRRFQLGERATTLVDRLRDGFLGAAWLTDDTIVLCDNGAESMRRIRSGGGTASVVARSAGRSGASGYSLPQTIGRRTDYVVALRSTGPGVGDREVVLVRLADGQATSLAAGLAGPVIASGHLLQPRPDGLFAAPFDTERLVLTGDAVRVADPIVWDPPTGTSSLSASHNGVLAFRPTADRALQFEWLNDAGRSIALVGPPAFYGAFALSPDGSRIVARLIPGQAAPLGSLRLIDIERGVVSPIVTPEGLVSDPIWTVDGAHIFYRLADALMRQSPFSNAADKVRDGNLYPDAVSSDGRWLLVGIPTPGGAFGLFAVRADGSGDPQPVSADAFTTDEGSFSPDGRLVSYHSTRTGRAEVYLSRFPPTGEHWQVSSEGGVQPRWSADGRTLYYLGLAGTLMRVAVPVAIPERIGRPEPLFDLGVGQSSATLEQYAVHADRFLVLRPSKDSAPQTVAIVSNWTSALLDPASTRGR